MNINSAIYKLYSGEKSIVQYKQYLTSKEDVNFIQYKFYKDGKLDFIHIEIPQIPEIIMISNVNIEYAKYHFIVDKNIKNIVKEDGILIIKKIILINIYNIIDYSKFKIDFDVTLAKISIRSCL